jgi:alpha-amylase
MQKWHDELHRRAVLGWPTLAKPRDCCYRVDRCSVIGATLRECQLIRTSVMIRFFYSLVCFCVLTASRASANPAIDTSPVPAQPRASTLAEGWQHGAFMEIFVRAYKDSNGDGIGDLRGLIEKLDYLRDLGIKGIWLMPITESADRDHGYATTDFRAIERDYGTLADFDALLKAAHERGIGVIVDYVVNHSAVSHPMFAASKTGPDSPYRNWYVWQPQAPSGWDIWGKNPWIQTNQGAYFATFGAHMPDYNLRNADVVAYHKHSLRFWLNRGLDGFRLDAVPHLIENDAVEWNDQPESRALTAEFTRLIKSYPRAHVVCEATAKPLIYGAEEVCGSAFAFTLERDIIKAVKGDREAMRNVANYFTTAPSGMATMVSNHDIFAGERLWDQVGGNRAQVKLAAATYLLLPGTPFIYYGEEIGMAGVKTLAGDMQLRTPMPWKADIVRGGFTRGVPFRPISPNVVQNNVASQMADPNSIFHFYKTMLKLRNTYPSIARGSYVAPFVGGNVLGYQRKFSDSTGEEHSLVLINYGKQSAKVALKALPVGATFHLVYPRAAKKITTNQDGEVSVRVPAQSLLVLSRKTAAATKQ